MKKPLLTTAKDLAYKAWCDGVKIAYPDTTEDDLQGIRFKDRFELWWSNNYGNSDSTKFYTKTNIYVENRKYIQAE